jgi:hypothetical protein
MRNVVQICVLTSIGAFFLLGPSARGIGQTPAGEPATSATPTTTTVCVLPAKVAEMRVETIIKNERSWGALEGTVVTLNVTGPDASAARRVGVLKIDKAVDDQGAGLENKSNLAMTDQPGFAAVDFRRKLKDGFTQEVSLGLAARSAKKIATLNGSLEMVVGGKETTVTIKDAKSQIDKPIEEPALVKAHLKLRIVDGKEGLMAAGEGGVAYVIEGNEGLVDRVELVDEKGVVVPSGARSIHSPNGPWVRTLTPHAGGAAERVGLRLAILLDAKIVKVPFNLADIPLP